METRKIGDICSVEKVSIKPKAETIYALYSLPAFDNEKQPEIVLGEEIKSSKLIMSSNSILFNKLNVHFRRVWNIEELEYDNSICSTEFLPLKMKCADVMQRYLYYILTSQRVTQSMYGERRGTSGSQQRIAPETLLEYEIPIYSMEDQQIIVSLLSDIDERILLNKKISNNLYEQMSAVYDDAVSDGDIKKTDDVVEFYDYMRKPLSSKQRTGMERNYPYYGAANIVDYVENYLFDGIYILLSEDGANVVDEKGYPLIQYAYGKFWVNNHAHVLKGKNGVSDALAYVLLKRTNMKSIVTGAAQPKINQENLKNLEVKVPRASKLKEVNDILGEMFSQIIINEKENSRLENMKEILLPQIMDGSLNLDLLSE